MKFEQHIIDAALDHARETAPLECCGLVVNVDGRTSYWRCENLSERGDQFIMSPDDYALCEDYGEIVGVVHSHFGTPPTPSKADLVGCEKSGLPWLIVNQPVGNHVIVEPSGYVAPLKGREFVHGVFDCYSIIRDYYKQVLNIEIPDYDRAEEWWDKGYDLYSQNFENAGFVEVPRESTRLHDVILMQCRSPVVNHGAVYIGENKILQHLTNRISSEDVYGGYWYKSTAKVVRHRSLL